MQKILWVKFGWSEYYRGGVVNGNFDYVSKGEKGHEAWNFLPEQNGTYYCYTPPQGKNGAPSNEDPYGWLVICLAKHPKYKGIHIVGWYENAELIGGYANKSSNLIHNFTYTIKSEKVWFIPPEYRNIPFSHTSIRQGKYSFLSGPNVVSTRNKKEVLSLLNKKLKSLESVAIQNPTNESAPDWENNSVDPMGGLGTQEHRKKVEKASVKFTKKHLVKHGYKCQSVEAENLGYDLLATRQEDKSTLHVEVKGTSLKEARFFMTPNEYQYRNAPNWRLAMVTDAIGKPNIEILTLQDVESNYDLVPMLWKAIRK